MIQFSTRRFVAAPPERVFALASNFADAPAVVPAIKRVEMLTPGPVRIGTKFRETRVMFKKEATETMEVTAFDPPRSYRLGCTSCGCRYESVFLFSPKDEGTDVELSFTAEPLTFLAKVMSFLMRPMVKSMGKMCAQDLESLALAAERKP